MKKNNKIDIVFASIFMALIPILSPYSILGVSIIWIIGAIYILFTVLVIDKGKVKIDKNILSYFSFPLVAVIISFNGFGLINNTSNLMNQLIGTLITIIIIYYIWIKADYRIFIKSSNIIAYICGIYAIIQFIMILKGEPPPIGKLEFLQLNSGQTWVPETWGFRINSLFSEPSYFALYLLPLFANSLKENNYKNTLIFFILIFISSSSLGIIGMVIITIWELIFYKNNSNEKRKRTKIIIFSLVCVIVLCVLISSNQEIKKIIERTIDKIYQIDVDSNDNIRLIGHIKYFSYYDLKEMLCGVGMSQFQNYFLERGIYLSNYSNSIVMIILQYGLIGLFFALWYYICIFVEANKKGTIVFFLILIIAMAVDFLVFSNRYYYLLYFILFYNSKHKTIKENLNETDRKEEIK